MQNTRYAVARTQRLRDILPYAALLGSHFSLHDLHIVMQLPASGRIECMLVCTAGSNVLHLLRDSAADDATTPELPSSSAGNVNDYVRITECQD